MLRYEEALARMIALGAPVLPAEEAELDDADGRVLAGELTATADLPAFDYSAMDGYAVRAADVAAASPAAKVHLHVRGESRTGVLPCALEPRTTMRIFTGAAIPTGADAVVMQENVTRQGDVVEFAAPPRPAQNIRRRGEDLARGVVALSRGTRLRPAHLALAGALDRARVPVARRPVVSILATGDELRHPGTEAAPGTIAESITFALRATARRAGAIARVFPYVRDERAATERALASALDEADVLVTTGGVSVGDHDLVRPALEAIGVTLDFWRVAIKPGKPIAVGTFARPGRRDAVVVGVPGNPSSAMITFALFGVPLLRAMQGDARPFPAFSRARMTRALAREPGRLEFARAVVAWTNAGLEATPLVNQASGAVTSMAGADALLCIPETCAGLRVGDEVDVLLLSELCG